ncbi:hypothetical protein GEV33_015402 [Tenebrio molitor]|uniref:BESS domain-containing protein n=2 Tax=Tenebrio molitor TaxID=7067 RepID=A0A8J6H3D6_TENMO|nr:hypothetical protein GEV33_015402 [Tenebrio molitor]
MADEWLVLKNISGSCGDKLRKKLKYLRDQFATEISKLKRPRSGKAAGETQMSKWQYFKSLYFLRNVIKCRPSSENLTRMTKSTMQNEEESQNTVRLDDNEITSTLEKHDYTASMLVLDIEKKKLDLLTQKVRKREANDQEDENLLFFKSLLPHIKKIQPERILAFRGRIQELVQEFAYSTNSFSFICTLLGSSVAAWLSVIVLRGHGPGASGFESHRRGRIFSKEGTSAGPWMCVYVYQGLTVGWWKEERHSSDTTARSAGFESQAGWASHGCCVLLYSCCIVQKKEKREAYGIDNESGAIERFENISGLSDEEQKYLAASTDGLVGKHAITEKSSSYLDQEWNPMEVQSVEIKRKTTLLIAFANLEAMMTLNTNEIKSEMAQLRQEMSELKTELKSFKSELLSEMTTQIRVLLEQEL